MSETLVHGLEDLFLSIAEKLAFLLGFPVGKELAPSPGREWLKAEVAIHGDVEGRLSLVVPADAATRMAADIMGIEPEDLADPALAADAVGELLNVVAGHVATALGGEEIGYSLSLPQVVTVAGADVARLLERDDSLLFDIEGQPYLLVVEVVRK